MSLKLYTYKGCGTCRKALAFLDSEGITYTQHPIRETPPSLSELRKMAATYNNELRKLFNTSGGTYKEMQLKDHLPNMSEQEQLDLLAKHGNLVKRPFVIAENTAMVGFKEDEWRSKLGL
ncbi:MAG: arsenate reductase family protein [Kiritimatiellae bacterium]|nr:arsenate reductase family protein [Kiritimatiellia bacterium]